jgi:hypothetical protein
VAATGLSNANRQAAGVVTGDEVDVDVELDTEPRVVVEPADFARVWTPIRLPGPPTSAWPTVASCSTCALSRAQRKPETRKRRIEKAVATLRDGGSGRAARAKTL